MSALIGHPLDRRWVSQTDRDRFTQLTAALRTEATGERGRSPFSIEATVQLRQNYPSSGWLV